MITELGHFALVLALAPALVQSTLPLIGARRGDAALMAVAPVAGDHHLPAGRPRLRRADPAPMCVSDFSVLNVGENSHSMKPLLYKITGVWGNHEGSMLLWVLILALFGALVAAFGGNLPDTLRAHVLARAGLDRLGLPRSSSSSPRTRSSASTRRRSKGRTSTRCCRTSASRSIRRCSISAMSASRSPSPSPSPR